MDDHRTHPPASYVAQEGSYPMAEHVAGQAWDAAFDPEDEDPLGLALPAPGDELAPKAYCGHDMCRGHDEPLVTHAAWGAPNQTCWTAGQVAWPEEEIKRRLDQAVREKWRMTAERVEREIRAADESWRYTVLSRPGWSCLQAGPLLLGQDGRTYVPGEPIPEATVTSYGGSYPRVDENTRYVSASIELTDDALFGAPYSAADVRLSADYDFDPEYDDLPHRGPSWWRRLWAWLRSED